MSDYRAPQRQFWSTDLVGVDLRSAAWEYANGLHESAGESDRRDRLLRYANQYLPEPITSLFDFETAVGRTASGNGGPPVGRSSRNIIRTLVDTAMSRFAKTETRIQFVTEGGTPGEQDRSESCTDAANALIEQTGAERQLRKGALHASVFDLGAVKVIDNPTGPDAEHVMAWEVMFDPADARRGKPTILVQRFPADREALVARFVRAEAGVDIDDERRAQLQELAADIRESGSGGMVATDHTPSDQHCLVYELWRLPVGGSPGRHVVVTDKALCLDEEWTDEHFPFVFFGFSENPVGPYPISIAAILSTLQLEIDGVGNRISQILRQCAVPTYEAHGPGAEKIALQVRTGGDAVGDIIIVPVGCELRRVTVGNVVGPELFQQEDRLWARGYTMTGISESAAQGSRPTGLNSAPSQREWNEIQQDRLSLVALEYQGAHVDIGERLLDSIAKIPNYEISVKDPNGRWLRRVKASDLQLDKSDYIIQKFPIGALPTTPSGKLAAAADLLQAQAIDKTQFQEIVQLPDLKSELDINVASRRATKKIISKMLAKAKYDAPLDMMDLEYAIKYATAKYLDGIADDMPDPLLNMLNDWINDCRAKLEAKATAAAPVAGPAGDDSLAGTSLAPITPAPLAPPPPMPPMGGQMGVS